MVRRSPLLTWKPIAGFPGYEVSKWGVVRRKRDGWCPARCPTKNGYLHVRIHRPDGRCITKAVHVLVCRAFNGRRPSARHEVSHRDGVKTNNRAANLRWATRAENYLDRVKHGTSNRGSRNGRAILDETMVKMVRELHKIPADVFARQLGVTAATIEAVRARRRWAWLK